MRFTRKAGPVLTQRLGQLLLKAARPAKTGVPRLRQIGLHGNHAYYAPDSSQAWETCFADYRNQEELVLFHQLRFLERVRYLIGGPHDELARHSIAGWIAEADFLMGRCPTHPLGSILIEQRNRVRHMAAASFTRFTPSDLVPRSVALSLLQRSIFGSAAHRQGFQINYSRYLSALRWPQSHLYPSLQVLKYSHRQLQAFIGSRWPQMHENEEEASALLWALRYPLG